MADMESVDHTAAEGLSEDRVAMSEVRDESIHISAWKANSPNFALTAFSEVRSRSILGPSHQTSGGGIMLVVERMPRFS